MWRGELRLKSLCDSSVLVSIAPLDNIMKAVGWKLEEEESLDDFFC